MSNNTNTANKPKSAAFEDINKFVEQKNSKQEPKAPIDVPKESAEKSETKDKKSSVKRTSKQYSKEEWKDIIKYRDANGLSAKAIAEKYEVKVENVYQWATKLGKKTSEVGEKDLVAEAKKMQRGITGELAEFDKKIADAKAVVASAAVERKKIEDKNEKYQQVIDLFETK